MTYQDGVFDINPDKEITGRTFEVCHGCGYPITDGPDHPWCSEACLDVISKEWWAEHEQILKDIEERKVKSEND